MKAENTAFNNFNAIYNPIRQAHTHIIGGIVDTINIHNASRHDGGKFLATKIIIKPHIDN